MTGLIGLLQVELPSHTAYLCDGGFIEFGGNTYTTNDSVLGTIASISPMSEGIGGDIPALDLEFNPPSSIAITDLTSGAIQRNTVRLWQAEYDRDTGLIVGTPELQFIGQLDQPAIRFSKSEYIVSISVVSKAEWFFELDIGNTLSPSFHKYLYAGETGHDNATGLSIPIAWGTEAPSTGSGSGSGSAGKFGTFMRMSLNQS
jgi:hypothetical protein